MNTSTQPLRPTRNAATNAVLALALGFCAAPLGFAQSSSDAAKTQASSASKASMTISTTRPVLANLPLRLIANGNVAAWQEAIIGSESSGLRLLEVRANIGDTVKKGQVLAVFAADSVEADLAQARAALAEAQAGSLDAAANAERARALQPSGVMSAQQIQQLMTAELTAKARLQSAMAALQQQELRMRHTRLLAPDSGVISARTATVGSVVGAGVEMFRLIRKGRLEWRAEVTSAELGRIKVGTPVQVSTPTGAKVAGKVRMVGPTVDVQTRNALVYVDIASADPAARSLKAGMYARGEFEIGSTNALTVPQEAVVMRDGFSYVFKLGAANKVAQQKIETGRRMGTQVEVTQGLEEGTVIALTGAGFLNDGDTVRIQNAASTPAQ